MNSQPSSYYSGEYVPTYSNYGGEFAPKYSNYGGEPIPKYSNFEGEPIPKYSSYGGEPIPKYSNIGGEPIPKYSNYGGEPIPKYSNYGGEPIPKYSNYGGENEPQYNNYGGEYALDVEEIDMQEFNRNQLNTAPSSKPPVLDLFTSYVQRNCIALIVVSVFTLISLSLSISNVQSILNNKEDYSQVQELQKSFEDLEILYNTYNIDGSWGDWKSIDSCILNCGGLVRHEVRECNNPHRIGAGKDCEGESLRSISCGTGSCQWGDKPVNGGWSSWTPVIECVEECEGNYRLELRYCNNPLPISTGLPCVGESMNVFSCGAGPCADYESVACKPCRILESGTVCDCTGINTPYDDCTTIYNAGFKISGNYSLKGIYNSYCDFSDMEG